MFESSSNKVTAPNCRQALQFRCAGFIGRCIRWQRPFPAAVGEFYRSTTHHVMKTLIAFLLLLAVTAYADDSPGITNKVTEIDRDKDGKIDVRIETVYRGKTKVMMIMSRRNQQGVMAVTRSYLADGKLVMAESDEDGDGSFESITVFRPDADSFEMFTRQSDGTVKPVSTQKLDSIRRQVAVADDSLRELFDAPEKTEKEIEDLLERNRQKIEAIKEEKPNSGD